MKTAFLFSGQGSQYYQMGRSLFEQDPVFRSWMQRLDDVVVGLTGESVLAQVYHPARNKAEPFTRTAITHPALVMTQVALARTLIERGLRPDLVVGASIGAFAAAAVAGCVEPAEAVQAAVEQARQLERHCRNGGMIAVLADLADADAHALRQHGEIAAFNGRSHFVVSATGDGLDSLESSFDRRGIVYQRLPVSFAFHSRWIDEVRTPYETFLRAIPLRTPQRQFMCCAAAGLLPQLPRDYFWRVVREPIQLQRTVTCLEAAGPWSYVDLGPGGSWVTLLRHSLHASRSATYTTLSPFGDRGRNLAALLAATGTGGTGRPTVRTR